MSGQLLVVYLWFHWNNPVSNYVTCICPRVKNLHRKFLLILPTSYKNKPSKYRSHTRAHTLPSILSRIDIYSNSTVAYLDRIFTNPGQIMTDSLHNLLWIPNVLSFTTFFLPTLHSEEVMNVPFDWNVDNSVRKVQTKQYSIHSFSVIVSNIPERTVLQKNSILGPTCIPSAD